MDNEGREGKSKNNREQNIKASNKIFFLNSELVRLVHFNRANDICNIYNFKKDKEQTMLYSDFKKHRKRAYSIKNTLLVFNRSRIQLERWIKKGLVPPPIGATIDGKRTFREMSYYSEDDLFTIRSVLATIHRGRPRKDGKIKPTKDVITEKELRSLIGDGIMLYTKTKSGEFIPIWAEETWWIMSDKTTVSVTLGYTLNLGNFQSLRLDLGCTDFVHEDETKDAAMDRVYEFIEAKLVNKIEEAKKELE